LLKKDAEFSQEFKQCSSFGQEQPQTITQQPQISTSTKRIFSTSKKTTQSTTLSTTAKYSSITTSSTTSKRSIILLSPVSSNLTQLNNTTKRFSFENNFAVNDPYFNRVLSKDQIRTGSTLQTTRSQLPTTKTTDASTVATAKANKITSSSTHSNLMEKSGINI
jgi:hypothetical protein